MTNFSDIDLRFTRNPVSNDVSILVDDAAIKASVKNLVLTDFEERPFQPTLGSSVQSLLFEPASPIIASEIESRIRTVLRNYETRIEILDIRVKVNPDESSFGVIIGFRMNGDRKPILLPLTLKRIR